MNLSIVIPVFNEEEVIDEIYQQLSSTLERMNISFEIIFVDDGSCDESYARIKDIARKDKKVHCLKFSRNFGHQMALLAGISEANGNYILMMDGDFQHPPSLIPTLYNEVINNIDIVYTIRQNQNVSLLKRITSKYFYIIFSFLSDVDLQQGSADFRIISKDIKMIILNFNERELFFRGMISWMGFSKKAIVYSAPPRRKGKSKYSFMKMLNFSLNGITSFSIVPLRLSLIFCVISLGFACLYSLYAIYIKIVLQEAVHVNEHLK